LNEHRIAMFMAQCEFVSIGNFCAISKLLWQFGLRGAAYPFDWVRSPATGIIHCFNTRFADFFQFANTKDAGQHGISFQNTAWGGSFWHHNILDPEVRNAFQRRIERILGLADVPPSKPRVFVRTMNSSEEIDVTLQLNETLRRAFPGTKVYLLILLDMQDAVGPVRIAGPQGDDLLFYKIPLAAAFTTTIDEREHGYWEALVFAIRLWACKADPVSEVPSLAHVKAACDPFDGNNPAVELYAPRRLMGLPPPAPLPPTVPPPPVAVPLPPMRKLRADSAIPKKKHKRGKWMDANGHRHSYTEKMVEGAKNIFKKSIMGKLTEGYLW